jgi:hypothetical protein
MGDMESAAEEAVALESRAEAAEGERDEALERLRCCTPRPPRGCAALQGEVGQEGLRCFQAALEAHPHWPVDDLAALLAGAELHAPAQHAPPGGATPAEQAGSAATEAGSAADGAAGALAAPEADGQQASPAEGASAAAGGVEAAQASLGAARDQAGGHLRDHAPLALGCLRAPLARGQLTRETVAQAVRCRDALPLVQAAEEEHAGWLAAALARPAASPEALVDFLVGATREGLPLSPAYYGCMQQHKQVAVGGAQPRPAAGARSCHQAGLRPLGQHANTRAFLQGITFDEVRTAIQQARMSTAAWVAAAEEQASLVAGQALLQAFEGSKRVLHASFRSHCAARGAHRRGDGAASRRAGLQGGGATGRAGGMAGGSPMHPMHARLPLCACLKCPVVGHQPAGLQRDLARRRREEEAAAERRNPLQQYLELLASQEEAAWKDFLIGMGQVGWGWGGVGGRGDMCGLGWLQLFIAPAP